MHNAVDSRMIRYIHIFFQQLTEHNSLPTNVKMIRISHTNSHFRNSTFEFTRVTTSLS